MTPIQKLAKLALDNPELRDDLVPIIKAASKGAEFVRGKAKMEAIVSFGERDFHAEAIEERMKTLVGDEYYEEEWREEAYEMAEKAEEKARDDSVKALSRLLGLPVRDDGLNRIGNLDVEITIRSPADVLKVDKVLKTKGHSGHSLDLPGLKDIWVTEFRFYPSGWSGPAYGEWADDGEFSDWLSMQSKMAGTYSPKDNWVLLDLAVQDAHKGKPDREWYRKDEGYTEVYDRTVKELKRKGRRAGDYRKDVLDGEKMLRGMSAGEIAIGIYNAMGDEAGYGFRSFIQFVKSNGPGSWRGFQSRLASQWKEITGPATTEIYEKEIDHGYDQPLSGGTDVMKRLQDQLLLEQGREPRPKNPRLAASHGAQRDLIAVLRGPEGREAVRQAVLRYAADTGSTVVVNAAVEDILENAVAVALDPKRMGAVIAKHTAKETP